MKERFFSDKSNYPAMLYLGAMFGFGVGMAVYNPTLAIDPSDPYDIASDLALGPH